MEHLPLEHLPPKLQEIAEYCGKRLALLLLKHYGGGHLHIPKTISPGHHLAEVLGLEDSRRFCEIYGGEFFHVPRADEALRATRNAAIHEMRAAGASLFELARRFGLTERHISNILKSSNRNK